MILVAASMLIGMLFMAGVLALVVYARRPQPDLQAAIANLSNQAPTQTVELDQNTGTLTARAGRWLLTRTHIQPNGRQRAQLQLRGTSLVEFYGNRLVLALGLGAMPWLFQLVQLLLGASFSLAMPSILTIALAILGWFLPVLQLRRGQESTSDDTLEAFLTLMDLVVLERVANRQAIDAITAAAFVSDAPLFVQVQRTLTRAVLENTTPWAGLQALAVEINLPELNDLVAIAQLQDQGAGLVDSLRARTQELRDAYLLRIRKETTRTTQAMTFPKMLPPMSVVILLIGAAMMNILLQGS